VCGVGPGLQGGGMWHQFDPLSAFLLIISTQWRLYESCAARCAVRDIWPQREVVWVSQTWVRLGEEKQRPQQVMKNRDFTRDGPSCLAHTRCPAAMGHQA
jgi:hypothetical protein